MTSWPEFKKPTQQMLKLCRQFLPDDEVSAVVGTLARRSIFEERVAG